MVIQLFVKGTLRYLSSRFHIIKSHYQKCDDSFNVPYRLQSIGSKYCKHYSVLTVYCIFNPSGPPPTPLTFYEDNPKSIVLRRLIKFCDFSN